MRTIDTNSKFSVGSFLGRLPLISKRLEAHMRFQSWVYNTILRRNNPMIQRGIPKTPTGIRYSLARAIRAIHELLSLVVMETGMS